MQAQYEAILENNDTTSCCVPTVCHVGEPIQLEDLSDSVKVICNNENCNEGTYMHKVCFDQWEETVLTYLRSTGRARSWSEKQRLQNLWTKKGYDLAYKACGCKCGKGHLRKDLDWIPPYAPIEEQSKKKKHRKKKNDKPCLTLNGNANQAKPMIGGQPAVPMMRLRSSSMSSTGSGSPPSSASTDCPLSPTFAGGKKNFFSDRRERHGSGSIFSRRQDYSSFNSLPRHKINSYHIKMEDEGSQGNFLFMNTFTRIGRDLRRPHKNTNVMHYSMLKEPNIEELYLKLRENSGLSEHLGIYGTRHKNVDKEDPVKLLAAQEIIIDAFVQKLR